MADRTTVTYEEWLKMPIVRDAVEEVVNGEIRITPPPKLPHAYVVEGLRDQFYRLAEERQYHVITGNFGLVIRKKPLTCRQPDLAIFKRDSLVVEDGYVR